MNSILTANNLTKRFGATVALNGVSFELGKQRLVGLIGQNGSGKTTLMDIIVGNTIPTSGRCTTLGQESAKLDESVLGRLGFVFQENRFLDWMSVEQHLSFFSSFYPRWDAVRQKSLLRELELDPTAKVGHLSSGNLQKLAIITAVCHHPDLLLLDEPVSALDPLARESLLQLIVRLLQEDEVTIIVSSHLLCDIERLVDWVICLDHGELMVNSSLAELQQRFRMWRVPARETVGAYNESFIRGQFRAGNDATLVVEAGDKELLGFRDKYRVEVTPEAMSLERIYPFLLKPRS